MCDREGVRGLCLLFVMSLVACAPVAPSAEPMGADRARHVGAGEQADAADRSKAAKSVESPDRDPSSEVADGSEAAESAAQASKDCTGAAIVAARTALKTAQAKGVKPAFLADCRSETATCPFERAPIEDANACQIFVFGDVSRLEVVIVPRPASGAPTQLEIWIDESGRVAGRVRISGSTWGVVDGVTIKGRGEYRAHTHGGPPAWIGGATFEVENLREQPITLTLTGTRWLRAYECELPRQEKAQPKPAGLALVDENIDGAMTVVIPAHSRKTVSIGHELQEAYMVSCDRFATAARFSVEGEVVEVIGEHRVIRRSPLRR